MGGGAGGDTEFRSNCWTRYEETGGTVSPRMPGTRALFLAMELPCFNTSIRLAILVGCLKGVFFSSYPTNNTRSGFVGDPYCDCGKGLPIPTMNIKKTRFSQELLLGVIETLGKYKIPNNTYFSPQYISGNHMENPKTDLPQGICVIIGCCILDQRLGIR